MGYWPRHSAGGAKDRILLDRFVYATMDAGLRRLALSHGVDLVEVGSLPDGTIDLEALEDLLDDRVRLVLVTHMLDLRGTPTDAAEVGQVLAGSEAIYALDVAQTVGQMPVDVRVIGCDVALPPPWKLPRGPRGHRALYVRQALADRLVPLMPSFGTEFRRARRLLRARRGFVGSISTRAASPPASGWGLRLATRCRSGSM